MLWKNGERVKRMVRERFEGLETVDNANSTSGLLNYLLRIAVHELRRKGPDNRQAARARRKRGAEGKRRGFETRSDFRLRTAGSKRHVQVVHLWCNILIEELSYRHFSWSSYRSLNTELPGDITATRHEREFAE